MRCLTATAEIPLAGLHANSILDVSALPIQYVGHGHAFRTEAGARGLQTKGLYRLHQFSKVEMFALTTADQAEEMLKKMVDVARLILDALQLSYR